MESQTSHAPLNRRRFATSKRLLANLVLLPVFLGAAPLFAADPSLDAFLQSTLETYHVPGAVVVIVDKGVVTTKCFGLRNVAAKEAVDEDTLFQLASVTKTFTGAAFGTNIDKSETTWDQPLRDILPAFALSDAYATQWSVGSDMLAHRSGLPAFYGSMFEAVGFNREEILQRIPKVPLATSFRFEPAYSNLGFFLVGEASAAAAGMTWENLVQTRLLQPLGMNRSGLASKLMAKDPNAARPYILTPALEIKETVFDTQPVLLPAGGLASSGKDMANYLQMWLNHGTFDSTPVLKPETVETLFQPIIAEEPGFAEMAPIDKSTGFAYGLGWGVYYLGNQRVLEKGGALEGFRSLVFLLPEQDYGAVILCNMNITGFPEAVRAELLERKLGRLPGRDLQAEIRTKWMEIQKMFLPPTPPEKAKPASLPLADYAGTFQSPMLGQWVFFEEEGVLKVKAGTAEFPGTLSHFDGDTFLVKWVPVNAGIHPVEFAISKGKVTGFKFDESDTFTRK